MHSRLQSVFLILLTCMLLATVTAAQSVPAASPLPDPVAYTASQFGASFKLDPKVAPMFGDLDGDGNEDLVLVGISNTPLLSQEEFRFKVQDPYDAYYGTGDPKITAQFGMHFDGSSRSILIVFGWRLPEAQSKPKRISKFVLINTPFEKLSIVNLRLKKKHIQAIEAVDRTTLHALVFWDGHRWRWRAQGMEGDDTLFKMPSEN